MEQTQPRWLQTMAGDDVVEVVPGEQIGEVGDCGPVAVGVAERLGGEVPAEALDRRGDGGDFFRAPIS
ncbi:hypothetical protein ACFCY8_33570 [Streptomyces noursei]|uniref:hypothetical protein n=1 Tax=Streptomyces noursei TaxID=1971 RepID=UPI0035D67572